MNNNILFTIIGYMYSKGEKQKSTVGIYTDVSLNFK